MQRKPALFRISSFMVLIALFASTLGIYQPVTATTAWTSKVDPWVMETAALGETEFIIFLGQQADLSAAESLPTKLEKGTYVYQTLSGLAARTQGPVIAQLKQMGAQHRSYWVANMLWVRGGSAVLQAMASRSDVAHVYANPTVHMPEPEQASLLRPDSPDAIEWNISKVNADDVWAAGVEGQGVVVGGQDTGYQWDHPALKTQYRGWDSTTADHNYNWHDAIHAGTTDCGINAAAPCDDHGHGTHTMGTMVGDDGGSNQIGMAPQARWIGCRNMAEGVGTATTYSECYEWFIAPTDLNNKNPRPDLAPDVINNSWGCPPDEEGCDDLNVMLTVVNNVRAAGIMTVHSAGNAGSSCSTVNTPAAIYDASYTVGNTTSTDTIASSSSRGPVTVDGSERLKPDISAPGTNIRSSYLGGAYTSMSGTSMAGPHVAGLVALLISADPLLAGQVDVLEEIINGSAAPVIVSTVQTCGGIPSTTIPNNTYGWGRIDAWAACQDLPHHLFISKTVPSNYSILGEVTTYTISLQHAHPCDSTTNVIVTDTLPLGTSFISASPAYTLNGSIVEWDLGILAANQEVDLTLAVQIEPEASGFITNEWYGARSDQVATVNGEPVMTRLLSLRFFLPLLTK